MFETNRWYEYKGRDFFENPPIYMKISKWPMYYIIALYPFDSIMRPSVSLFGPFKLERDCDLLMNELINN